MAYFEQIGSYKRNSSKTIVFSKMKSIFVLFSFFVLRFVELQAYCWQPGWNPSFKGPPVVTQIDMSTVYISWKGLVIMPECTDQVFF
jgi:hypothetical protein